MNGEANKISVVIATLGGSSLAKAIAALNQGTTIPDEILVCIPKIESRRIDFSSTANVKILATECRGQVAQRAMGFRFASNSIVMQLDDDLIVEKDCIAKLVETLETVEANVAVAPSLVDMINGQPIYQRAKRKRIIEKLYYWLMNGSDGYVEGSVHKSGSAVGVDSTGKQSRTCDTEWLAGGCIAHRRENLIFENFFPYEGKAYCEDLLHSHYLSSSGVRLLIDLDAKCKLDNPSSVDKKFHDYFKELYSDFCARKYYMRISGRNSLRVYLFYIIAACGYLLKKMRRMLRGGPAK